MSDKVAILKNGRLVREGSVEEFISIKQQFQLQVGKGDEETRLICMEMNIPLIAQNGHFIVSVSDDDQLNTLIDRLRAQNIIIQGITPRKISLEDFFIDVIEADKEAAS